MIDTSLCTACRGCQIACKQWNELPGTKTKQIGTYQNPQDFSAFTWKLVRFSEGKNGNGKPYWYFFSDMKFQGEMGLFLGIILMANVFLT